MSGPQGSDPTQPWQGQQPEQGADQPTGEAPANQGWQPPSGSEQAPGSEQWQPPAYTPQQYPQYQQPPAYPPQQYPGAEQYGQQQPDYSGGYPPPGQYGQPGAYGQQYGQPPGYGQQPGQYGQQPGQFGQQPGQYGQYPGGGYPAPGSEDGSKRSLAVIGGVVGVAEPGAPASCDAPSRFNASDGFAIQSAASEWSISRAAWRAALS